jgi:hypothetical protein
LPAFSPIIISNPSIFNIEIVYNIGLIECGCGCDVRPYVELINTPRAAPLAVPSAGANNPLLTLEFSRRQA